MNIETFNLLFKWIAIIAAGLSFAAAIGGFVTGGIIDHRKNEKITSIQSKLAAVQPRSLSSQQRIKLKEKLLAIENQNVVFVTRMMDSESADYANQIQDVFRDTGWAVGPMNASLLDDLPGFLTAAVSSDNNPEQRLNAVKDAFIYAGVDFRSTSLREGSLSIKSQPNTIYVIVGRKSNK